MADFVLDLRVGRLGRGFVWYVTSRDTPAEHHRVSASELALINAGLTLGPQTPQGRAKKLRFLE